MNHQFFADISDDDDGDGTRQHGHHSRHCHRGGTVSATSSSTAMMSQQLPQHYSQYLQHGTHTVVDNNNLTGPAMSLGGYWSHDGAIRIAESIQNKVRIMLSASRLVRNTSGIQYLKTSDILQVHHLLGSGAFSQVTSVTARTSPVKRCACKHLKRELMVDTKAFITAASELAYEAHMLSSFDHPNIIKIQGWAANGIASFEEGKHNSFFLLLDLLDETLDHRIDRWKTEVPRTAMDQHLRQLEKLRTLAEVAEALDYIHSKGVVFRDLKPQNIGFVEVSSDSTSSLRTQRQVKLFDFGLSRELPILDTTQSFKMSGKVGTIRYMAPEVCLYQPYGTPCDIYSWSMVAYEILSQVKPYECFTPEMYCSLVCHKHVRPTDPVARQYNAFHSESPLNQTIPNELFVLLDNAWCPVPTHRLSLREICAQLDLFSKKEQLLLEKLELGIFQQQRDDQYRVATNCATATEMVTSPLALLMPPPPPPAHVVSPDGQHSVYDTIHQQSNKRVVQYGFGQHQFASSFVVEDHSTNSISTLSDVDMQDRYQNQSFYEASYCQPSPRDFRPRKSQDVVDLTRDDDEPSPLLLKKVQRPSRKRIIQQPIHSHPHQNDVMDFQRIDDRTLDPQFAACISGRKSISEAHAFRDPRQSSKRRLTVAGLIRQDNNSIHAEESTKLSENDYNVFADW